MSFLWEFETEGRTLDPAIRRCHRGPMIPVEIAMSKPFTVMTTINGLRGRVMGVIVDTTDKSVRTRETLLRVLHSNIGSVFSDYRTSQADLEVLICEKRNSIEVAADLDYYQREFLAAEPLFRAQRVSPDQIGLIHNALVSKNAILRVAGYCAVVLLGAVIEIRG